MSWLVNIYWGASPATPGVINPNIGGLIGKGTVPHYSNGTEVNPVRVSSSTQLTTTYLMSSTDSTVKAAEDYFAAGGRDLWVYVISGEGETVSDAELDGLKNGSNKTFSSYYAPLVSIENVEYNKDGSGWVAQTEVTHYTTETTQGVLNGSITFSSAGPYYSGVSGIEMGIAPGATDKIRADVTIDNMAAAFGALASPQITFGAFTFAYDQDKDQTLTTPTGDWKYASGNCYGGKSWLDDVLRGSIMATQFNAINKRCQFYFGLPDKVRPGTTITDAYATGTSYTGSLYTYGDVEDIVGENKYVIPVVEKGTSSGYDSAAVMMATQLKDNPRKTMSGRAVGAYSQTIWPDLNEIRQWQGKKINTISKEFFISGNSTVVYTSNKTLGTGDEGHINYVRTKQILSDYIDDALKALLLTCDVKYNYDGCRRIYDAIYAAVVTATNNGYIDGFVSISIPIMSYLYKESSATSEELAIIASARATNAINNITLNYKWDGDIESVTVNALVSS